jgi:nucleoside-diphosphate-sugar epimerase
VARIAKAQAIDTVIDLLAYTQAATAPLMDALDGCISRYVLTSSCDVYRNFGIVHRKEEAAPLRGAIDEDSPLRQCRFLYRDGQPRSAEDPSRWLDDYDKIPIEEGLITRTGFDWTILRLPMVFGPGDRQRRFRWIIEPMAGGAKSIAVPRAWAGWRTTYGYVEDVAAGIALAAGHPAAARRIFNLGMSDVPTQTEWVARFAAVTSWHGEITDDIDASSPLGALAARLDLTASLIVATQRIRAELGYCEVTDPTAALRSTIDDEPKRAPAT